MRAAGRWVVVLAVLAWAREARAKCPQEDPGAPQCEPIASMLMPSVSALGYFPRGDLGAYWGGGVELPIISWSHNNDSFGPSQGKVRLDVDYLGNTRGDRRILLYRFGAVVSFEGNASRRYMIPYFGGSIGGLSESELGSRFAIDASLGLFFIYTRGFVLDAEVGYLAPVKTFEDLGGPKTQLTASFALW